MGRGVLALALLAATARAEFAIVLRFDVAALGETALHKLLEERCGNVWAGHHAVFDAFCEVAKVDVGRDVRTIVAGLPEEDGGPVALLEGRFDRARIEEALRKSDAFRAEGDESATRFVPVAGGPAVAFRDATTVFLAPLAQQEGPVPALADATAPVEIVATVSGRLAEAVKARVPNAPVDLVASVRVSVAVGDDAEVRCAIEATGPEQARQVQGMLATALVTARVLSGRHPELQPVLESVTAQLDGACVRAGCRLPGDLVADVFDRFRRR